MSDLDDAESRAIGMIQFFQEQCAKQCEPYIKIISQIRSIRPPTFVVDGKTMVPIMGATDKPSVCVKDGGECGLGGYCESCDGTRCTAGPLGTTQRAQRTADSATPVQPDGATDKGRQ